jgi:Na+-transporting NADH:ubiquinone oxidoreductase subunit NqrF
MTTRTTIIWLILFLCPLVAGCANQSIQVAAAAPLARPISSETLDLRNCDSNEEMNTSLESEAPVRLRISIAEEAISAASGESIVIPAETQAAVIAQIESVYQPEYEQAVARVEQVQLVVPGHKIHMYDIHWNREVYSSTVSFSIENEPCTAAYTYELDIPELGEHFEMSCTA